MDCSYIILRENSKDCIEKVGDTSLSAITIWGRSDNNPKMLYITTFKDRTKEREFYVTLEQIPGSPERLLWISTYKESFTVEGKAPLPGRTVPTNIILQKVRND